jgi:truncated hemoglobin YjbI
MAGAISTDENGNTTYDWDSILSNGSVLAALNALTEAYPEAKNVVMSIMERLGLDISNYKFSGFDNLADSILESLKGADTSLEKWAEEQGKKMAEEMAKAYIESKYGEQIKALNEEWQKALEKGDVARMEEIRKELEALYDTMGNDEKLKNLVDVFKELAENPFKDMASTFVSSLMDMENGAEEFSKNIAKTLTEQMLNKIITDQYQGKIDALGEQWRDALASGDTAAIERIRQQLIALREEMGEAVQPLIDSLSDLDTQVSYALNDMKSNFVSTLMDMTASTQDFANDISKIMAQTFIEKFVLGDMFDQRMESWQQQYESILGSDVDEETRKRQLKQLRDAIAAAREDYTDQANAIMELFGLTASSNQEATMNMADKITYDQADQLLGINLAQELTLEQILATLRENYVSPVGGGGLTWQSANGVQSDEQIRLISATLQSIADVQQTGNDNILTQVVMANSHLQLIRDYSKNIRDEVLLHLGSIDSKLTQLKNL